MFSSKLPAAEALPHLEPGDVHVVVAEPDVPAPRDAEATLSHSELERANGFRFAADRAAYVRRRALLRMVLGRYLGTDPGRVPLEAGSEGKPRLRSDARGGLTFNASSSDGTVVVALSRGTAIGVDVERLRDVAEAELIVEREFTAAERAQLAELCGDAWRVGFFHGWTRKEACLKALGRGLLEPLDRFSVSLGPDAAPLALDTRTTPATAWCVADLPLGGEFVGAVASPAPWRTLQCWRWAQTRAPQAFD